MAAASEKHWVMLVAGSKRWKNYRHQANVCHAYKIMHQNGVPDDQIVVMMYDDIAYNPKNPYPGNIINKPNGPDVYPRVPKDYTGEDVTPENFLAALTGDRSAVRKRGPKKVITSDKNDTIFVYLTDHGSPGLFGFPNSTLYAHDLITAIKKMVKNHQFSKMVIYLESCHSGSMFAHLPSNVHVYAVTSTKANEKGYACYHDRVRKTFLSDEFSAVWMDYKETVNLEIVTFQDQFHNLQKKMKKSCSCRFGDMTVSKRPISEFLKNTPRRQRNKPQELVLTDLTSTHDVPFKILNHRIETETDAGRRQDLIRKLDALHRTKAKIERTVEAITRYFPSVAEDELDGDYSSAIDLQDFKTVAEHFRTRCFNWHEEEFQMTLSYMHVFAHLCACGIEVEKIKEVITTVRERSSVFP
ncbi:legumain-like isoform X2 [Triplophysa rosa]|uniref:legumain n=1 Tax=Triplophysa rosa TaxID=992332 RepID=A0A9W7WDF2_TRIRA|nr:legumain-like isoform X2 [Triplophysa rosa]KAI7797072.1 putative legumain-like [Triplophysa rosa]